MLTNKKHNVRNVEFIVHKPIEFTYAVSALSIKLQYSNSLEIKAMQFFDLESPLLKSMYSNLPPNLIKEIKYFLFKEMSGFLMELIGVYPDAITIPNFIDKIEDMDTFLWIKCLGKTIAPNKETKDALTLIQKDYDRYVENIFELIQSQNISNKRTKDRMFNFFKNPQNTKDRFVSFLRQFYEQIYKHYELQIIEEMMKNHNRYKMLFETNEEKFVNNFLSRESNEYSNGIKIHTSYLFKIGKGIIIDETNVYSDILCIGEKEIEYLEEVGEVDSVHLFLKALSDRNRLEMALRISNRPWYVHELAEDMGIAPSTTSHHLSFLQNLGLVKWERKDHKMCYSLNREKVKEMTEKLLLLIENENV